MAAVTAEPTPPPTPALPLPDDPDLLRAMLIAAREERDRQFCELVAAHDWINGVLTNPAYRALRRSRQLVRRGARPRPPKATVRSARLTAPATPGALWVDITPLDESMRSGIARVTIRLAQELDDLTCGRVELVRPVAGRFRRDLSLEAELLATPGRVREAGTPPASQVSLPAAGVFLSACVPPRERAAGWWQAIAHMQASGGIYAQIVHDLIPVSAPDFFDQGLRAWFPEWLGAVADRADVIIAVSQATLDDLEAWLATRGEHCGAKLTVVRNGADVGTDGQLPADGEPGPSPRRGTDVLVVGTIEPRKGVEAVLDAAAELHRRGSPVRFTLVGTKGWIGDSTLRRLQAADAGEQNLRWLQRVGDADLVELYRSADLLLAPSRAEGYGLPVVEARAWGLPVLARDLPVFREVGGTDTRYFGTDAELPDAIEAALAAPTPGGPVSPRSWSAAAADVLAALPGDATGRC
ncbi:MAG: glycosyltransferase family 1 protein [Actinobacteria bacterium]|nr:MAG: glycosyltransferase family 1 protein [Actinomycetota bacterium]